MLTRRHFFAGFITAATLPLPYSRVLSPIWTTRKWDGRTYAQCFVSKAPGKGLWGAICLDNPDAPPFTTALMKEMEDFLVDEVTRL